MIGRAEERGGRTRGRVRTQRDRCCLEHTPRAPGVSGHGAFGPSGTWPARAPAEMGPRRTGKGREGSAVRLTTAVDVVVPAAVGAGHTCDSPLMVVCLMVRVGAVRLANGRVGVMTIGGATSVAMICRAYPGYAAAVAMSVASRVLRVMVQRLRQYLGHVRGRGSQR